MAIDTYAAERDYLAAHPELLEAAAGPAVAEVLLAVPEDEAGRYAALRQAAQHDSADAAYRPLLLTTLAREFAGPTPAVSVPCSPTAPMTCSPARSRRAQRAGRAGRPAGCRGAAGRCAAQPGQGWRRSGSRRIYPATSQAFGGAGMAAGAAPSSRNGAM